jgi:MFS family permease
LLEGRAWLPPSVKTAILSAIFWCVAIAVFALSTNYYFSLGLLFFAGVLNLAFSSMAQTIVQLMSPPQLRGRLIGLYAMASMGLKAFSGVTVGVVGGLVGVHWSLAGSAMTLLAITVALFAFTIPGQRQANIVESRAQSRET